MWAKPSIVREVADLHGCPGCRVHAMQFVIININIFRLRVDEKSVVPV